ncbi:acyl-CoA dehydrogenase family protein [Terricaulis silvestris]|uniref:Acyl-CoA dehydrogenase n=1 Tax=Terricaulis silvestris TaxID=2686094 RepID=A0A6I6MS10_9CAUL|nr:acyl-CoA dehydrogenase family protein [Terricaulis silvestris]QGZ96206.1 Acyl-CoA dehydrogenase [Terricaulis silvestris]
MAPADKSRRFSPMAHRDDLDAFRAEVRAWLQAIVPEGWFARSAGAPEGEYLAFQRWWFDELQKVGLATPHWPKDWGGEELTLRHQVIVSEEMVRAGAPNPDLFVISLYHLPATLFAHGSPAQRERYLKGVTERGEIWCQGFSEPNAGSDLASLRTRAERRDDIFVVNGQKVWSSFAAHADYCLLLARTDVNAPKKQAGISYFILDMKAPGVTVRRIKQMTGQSEFCEIFLDNVEIPAENLIGAENAGWMIAQSTLSAERGLIIFDLAERMHDAFQREIAAARVARPAWWEDDELRRAFVAHYGDLQALRLMIQRMLRELEANAETGASSLPPLIKVQWSELLRRHTDFWLKAGGLEAQKYSPPLTGGGHVTGNRLQDFMWSYSWTIAGGANEIIKTLIAERVLGLPR